MSGEPADLATVAVSIHSKAWLAACPNVEALVESAAGAAMQETELPAGAAIVVGIVLTDDAEQRELNRTYRGKDAPTNVLSFPLADLSAPAPAGSPVLLGDVVLAFETISREAAEQRKAFSNHLCHLVVHGVLHLLGFDHEDAAEAAVMEAREVAILKGLGVPAPYDEII